MGDRDEEITGTLEVTKTFAIRLQQSHQRKGKNGLHRSLTSHLTCSSPIAEPCMHREPFPSMTAVGTTLQRSIWGNVPHITDAQRRKRGWVFGCCGACNIGMEREGLEFLQNGTGWSNWK